jgi:hypothetical protein
MSQQSHSQITSPDLINTPLASLQVDLRKELPAAIKSQLLPIARVDWSNHPSFGGSAAFFIQYHGNLLNTAQFIVSELLALLSKPAMHHPLDQHLKQILRSGVYLVDKAHHHHYIEDNVYFPQFRKLLPSFSGVMDLLDSDHQVLDNALQSFKKDIDKLFRQTSISEKSLNLLHLQANHLYKILKQHLQDEEEIIIPIFLMGS